MYAMYVVGQFVLYAVGQSVSIETVGQFELNPVQFADVRVSVFFF